MTQIDLANIPTPQLCSLGDAALRAGNGELAKIFYRAILDLSPTASHIIARMGFVNRPSERCLPMLDVLSAIEQIRPTSAFVGEGLATWLKTLPFLDDARFMALAEQHSHLLPTTNWHWNLQTVLWAVQQVRALEGDFVELGVFKGHTTRFIADYIEFGKIQRTWWLYDTFDGIPEDQLDSGWATPNKLAYQGRFSFEEVRDRFSDIANIEVIKGRVPEVLAGRSPERIAFIHIDLNNAAAEIGALDLLFDRIVPGGVIVFDDFGWFASRKQYDAEKAWFAKRGLVLLPIPTGQGVFIKQP